MVHAALFRFITVKRVDDLGCLLSVLMGHHVAQQQRQVTAASGAHKHTKVDV